MTGNEVVLAVAGKLHKIGGVTGNAYDQIAVLVGIFLRLVQILGGNHIELSFQHRRFSYTALTMSRSLVIPSSRLSAGRMDANVQAHAVHEFAVVIAQAKRETPQWGRCVSRP